MQTDCDFNALVFGQNIPEDFFVWISETMYTALTKIPKVQVVHTQIYIGVGLLN